MPLESRRSRCELCWIVTQPGSRTMPDVMALVASVADSAFKLFRRLGDIEDEETRGLIAGLHLAADELKDKVADVTTQEPWTTGERAENAAARMRWFEKDWFRVR